MSETVIRQRDIERLREQLRTAKRKKQRVEAAEKLGAMGVHAESAVPDLIEALEDFDHLVRIWAADALGRISVAGRAAIDALFRNVLRGDNSAIAASSSIAALDPDLSFLIRRVQGDDTRAAVAAAFCLYNGVDAIKSPGLIREILGILGLVRREEAPAILRDAALLAAGAVACNPLVRSLDGVSSEWIEVGLLDLMAGPSVDPGLKAAITLGQMGQGAAAMVPRLLEAVVQDVWWSPFALEAIELIDNLAMPEVDLLATPEATAVLRELDGDDIRKLCREDVLCYSLRKMEERRVASYGPSARRAPQARSVEVVGVHGVEAEEPCHLVEVVIRGSAAPFDIGDFSQPKGDPASAQVAWDEKFLEPSGESEREDAELEWPDRNQALKWIGDVRVAFFLHDLEPHEPLQTPFGAVELPPPSPRPDRLSFMTYSRP